MKKLFTKFIFIFAFILCFALNVFAAGDLNITSVVYDNSASFLSINTPDNDEYTFSAQPKLYVVPEEKKAYFDINSSVLRCPAQNLVITSSEIKEIVVKQFSANPNIVRVVIYYNDGYDPNNIQLKKLNNTLIVRFANTQIQNFYFQQVYTTSAKDITPFYESVSIQTPVVQAQNNILNQIDSAFNLGIGTNNENYVLSKKDLMLPTKYYVDNVNIKNSIVYITGIGSAMLSKPMLLSNPSRIAYDIPNAFVNHSIRNKTTYISQNETIKIGQFDRTTARVVITSPNADKYIPVIYADTQRIAFIDKLNSNPQKLYNTKAVLNNITDEINDAHTHSVKLIFSKPIVFGLERTASNLNLLFYNAEAGGAVDIDSSLIFEGAKILPIKNGGIELMIPSAQASSIDVHLGTDGKTLRIKETSSQINLPAQDKPEISVPAVILPQKNSNKRLVVLDPGHGGSDVGCTRNDIYEKNITLDISNRIAELLEKKGYEVIMTRDRDATVSLQDRVAISEAAQPDIFVSVHVNSSNSESPNGIETHYYKDNSLLLAKTLHASMLNHVKANDRGLFKSKFYVINHTTAPAVLVEIGFISNPAERAQLVSESRKQATAKAIAEGIDGYFK